MAVDMFIKVGTIEGESVDKTHAGKIDVLAWSWGMSQSGTTHQGGGGGAGKVNGELLSYLFFEQEFLAAAVALGQKDARRLIDTSTQQLSWQIHMEEDGRTADLRHDLSRSAQNIRTE